MIHVVFFWKKMSIGWSIVRNFSVVFADYNGRLGIYICDFFERMDIGNFLRKRTVVESNANERTVLQPTSYKQIVLNNSFQ